MKLVSVEKSKAEVYKLRFDDSAFANISLEEGENTGRITISCDWGCWSHYWNGTGKPFKEFLCSINDPHYLASKFRVDQTTCEDWFALVWNGVWKEFIEILKAEKDSVVLDENTPVSMLEYNAAVSSLSETVGSLRETVFDLRKHVGTIQSENMRLKQRRRR